MSLSKLAANIKRLHEVQRQRKALEAEEDVLKKFFRDDAGEADGSFEFRDLEVVVTWKERAGWDSDLLTAKLGGDAAKFKKTSRYAEVSCRVKKEAA